MKKPLALIILDGFGNNPSDYGNAIHAAKTPNLDKLFETCPHTLIGASGMDVGLPDAFELVEKPTVTVRLVELATEPVSGETSESSSEPENDGGNEPQ